MWYQLRNYLVSYYHNAGLPQPALCWVFLNFNTYLYKLMFDDNCWAFRIVLFFVLVHIRESWHTVLLGISDHFFYSFFTQRSVLFCFFFVWVHICERCHISFRIGLLGVSVTFSKLHFKWKIKFSHLITFVLISQDLIIASVEHNPNLYFLNGADDNFYLQVTAQKSLLLI